MSINQKSSKPRIDRLAQKLVELVEMFRKKDLPVIISGGGKRYRAQFIRPIPVISLDRIHSTR